MTPTTPEVKPKEKSALRIKWDADAEDALARADSAELHRHYKMAMEKCDRMSDALTTVADHYISASDTPRYAPSNDAIEAMERVALAAIELAKSVTTPK